MNCLVQLWLCFCFISLIVMIISLSIFIDEIKRNHFDYPYLICFVILFFIHFKITTEGLRVRHPFSHKLKIFYFEYY